MSTIDDNNDLTNQTITEQEVNIIVSILSAMAGTAGLVIALASLSVPAWVPIILLAAKEAPAALKILENVHPILAKLIVLAQDKTKAPEDAAQELVDWIQEKYSEVLANVPTNYNNEIITDV